MLGHAGQVHAPGRELDDEQDVERLEPDLSTVKKSVARIPAACDRRNWVQVGPVRRGAGFRPDRSRIVRTVVAEILIPSFSSSPRIRWYPQRGFSLPRRTTSARASGSIGGRPG